jgi:hypothetical protein
MKEIKLSKGLSAQVDDEDFDWLNQWKWSATKSGKHYYAYRNIYVKSKYIRRVSMHRLIMGDVDGLYVDHIDGNGINNQRNNLRNVTGQQNCYNWHKESGEYVGVRSIGNYWGAFISIGGNRTYIGRYRTKNEAAVAYNDAAIATRGQYASINDVDEDNRSAPIVKYIGRYTSRYRGVSRDAGRRLCEWRAEIRVNHKVIYLGNFNSEKEAALAFNDAAIIHRGEKAVLNEI